MITVRLSGGLGNQLFQYAAARALALRHNTRVCLDTSYYGSWLSRPYENNRSFDLMKFNLADPLVPSGAALALVQTRRSVAMRLRRSGLARMPNFYVEKDYTFDPAVGDLPDGSDLRGYFQTEKYFAEIAADIRKEFVPKDAILQQSVSLRVKSLRSGDRPLVALQVRRGDYLTFKKGAMLQGLAESLAAVALFPDCDFLVVSDDLAWCRENFSGPQFRFSPFQSDLEDFVAMIACDHAITARSTFGWWGAWLNPNPAKKVAAPASWFTTWDNPGMDRDIYPASWITF